MKRLLFVIFTICIVACTSTKPVIKPWNNKIQTIPGRLECELYDVGGESVAYHDADSINNGSGKLNPANGDFLNEFRMKEGVDISFTKAGNIDNNPFNKKDPVLKSLYVGWTQPGEWINYTIHVTKLATYQIGLMYTANGDGIIAFDIDGKNASGLIKIPSTHDDRDTIGWRQWHHWNKIDALSEIKLRKGTHVLTLHVIENGNMNLDYLEFKEK